MARKNPFEGLMDADPKDATPVGLDFPAKGASRSVMNTIDELADRADLLLEGETIVELDPDLIDPSFVQDRVDEDEEEFETLVQAIKEEGQKSPILVRPHPQTPGRYMMVFGAQRRMVAERLGIKVRAVVKQMNDRDHVVAQGQENAARANLSFIEKAMFAAEIVRLQYDADNATVMSALSVDRATLSKLLSVASIPTEVFSAIGAAKSIGRDRWYELKILLEKPANLTKAVELVTAPTFSDVSSDERFNCLLGALKKTKKTRRSLESPSRKWAPKDQAVSVDIKNSGKGFTLSLKGKKDGGAKFGEYISSNLEALYEAFKQETESKQGE